MIARIWRGWAPRATADDYQRHYESEVGEHLQAVDGFRGARLLRRDEGQEVMFTSITWFTSVDAVRGFAGDDYEQAVVEEAARQALSRGTGHRWPSTCAVGEVAHDGQRVPPVPGRVRGHSLPGVSDEDSPGISTAR